MVQHFNLLALPQRSLHEGAKQVRVRMVSKHRTSLQPLSYDFGYFRHF
jgi:hypothetical protein